TGDPVRAWAEIVSDPERARRYKSARGRGGLVRAGWDEATEMIAAAHVHTIKAWGPDRIAGFSPIPAMSMVSHASGARFVSLLGGTMLSFYDWYADLPVASPQVFGDQTDVPESGDWWDAAYLIMWGSNLPVTRTPDAHWMAEARYRGQKVVAVSPDYADRQVPYFIGYGKRYTDLPFLVRLEPAGTEDGQAYVPGKFLTAADLPGA